MLDRSIAPKVYNFQGFQTPIINKYTLSNGISCYGIDNHSINLIRLDIRIYAGSTFQKKISVARACINLLQEGTLHHSAEEIAEKMDFAGAYYSTSSAREYVGITIYFPKTATESILLLLTEMLTEATFPEDKINIFKQKIKNELAIKLEKNAHLGYFKLIESLYGENHPYGQIANLNNVDAFLREDIVDFYNQYFHAGNIKLFFAGNLDESFYNTINQHFEKIQKKDVTLPILNYESSLPAKKIYIEKENAVQTSVYIGKRIFTSNNPNWTTCKLLNMVLGGYFGSRLMSNIRESKGLAYNIYSRMTPMLFSGLFYVSADVNKEQANLVVEEIYAEFSSLQNQLITEEELNIVKNYIYGSRLRTFDGVFNQLEQYIELVDFQRDESYWQHSLNIIQTTTSQTLYEIAQTFLNKEDFTEIIVG